MIVTTAVVKVYKYIHIAALVERQEHINIARGVAGTIKVGGQSPPSKKVGGSWPPPPPFPTPLIAYPQRA